MLQYNTFIQLYSVLKYLENCIVNFDVIDYRDELLNAMKIIGICINAFEACTKHLVSTAQTKFT